MKFLLIKAFPLQRIRGCTHRSFSCGAVIVKFVRKHLMPILIGDYDLLDDLLEIFIGYLNNTIHIGSVRRRMKVLNLPLGVKFDN